MRVCWGCEVGCHTLKGRRALIHAVNMHAALRLDTRTRSGCGWIGCAFTGVGLGTGSTVGVALPTRRGNRHRAGGETGRRSLFASLR